MSTGCARLTAQQLAEEALRLSTAHGCIVVVTEETERALRWAGNSLTTHGTAVTRQVVAVAVVESAEGIRVGVASLRGDVNTGLPDVVQAAHVLARAAEPAEDGQPLVHAGASQIGWDAPVEQASTAAWEALTPSLGGAFTEAGGRGHLLYGYAEDTRTSTFLASSSGVRLRTDQASRHVEMTARTGDGSRSAWGCVTGDISGDKVAGLHAHLQARLGWGMRRVAVPPGRYETLLPPAAVADLMSHAYWAAGAREAAEGQSVYSAPGGGTRIGERLSDLPLTLRGDPAAPGLECAPFVVAPTSDGVLSVFDNGLPVPATAWIQGGVLTALLQSRYSSALTGLPLTPPVDNLILEVPGEGASLDDLVARTERGLLLTSLWYLREVDPATLLLTGLTRDGVYLVDGGEVVGSVTNFRFNESPIDLLGRIIDVGAPVPTRAREWADAVSHAAMPPVRVADFTMSSVSPAT